MLPTSVAGKEATFNDVVFSSDTLTDILKWAKEKMYPGTAMTTPETDPDTTEDGWTEPTTPEATKGADGTNVSLDAALRNILDGHKASLDSDEIRELIVAEVTKATEASQLGVKRVEITLPEGKTVTTEGEHDLFATLVQEMTLGHATLLAGPAGSGKTTACERAAEALGLTYFIQPPVADRFELLGFVDASGRYQESPAYRWATTPNSVLILDELDRSHPGALTAVHSMLANGIAVFPNGQIQVPPENRIVATANTWGTGPDAEYTGSARLDAATLNRFVTRLAWGYDLTLERRIVALQGGHDADCKVAQAIRVALGDQRIKLIWSPRDTIAFCRRVATGTTLVEALERSVLATLKPETFEAILSTVGVGR